MGAINCQADMDFEQMMDTKKQFGKTDKRQGYHIILSFKEDEVEPDRAFEIAQKFVAEYLGDAYEAVFVVHDNGKTILLTQLIGNRLDILCPVTFLVAILFPIHKAYTVKYNV